MREGFPEDMVLYNIKLPPSDKLEENIGWSKLAGKISENKSIQKKKRNSMCKTQCFWDTFFFLYFGWIQRPKKPNNLSYIEI